MTQELARSMQEFQGSMSQEVHRGGKPDGSVMADPEMSTFWIMQVVYPSSEDVTLMAIDVKASCPSWLSSFLNPSVGRLW